jgi:hypothetical protein
MALGHGSESPVSWPVVLHSEQRPCTFAQTNLSHYFSLAARRRTIHSGWAGNSRCCQFPGMGHCADSSAIRFQQTIGEGLFLFGGQYRGREYAGAATSSPDLMAMWAVDVFSFHWTWILCTDFNYGKWAIAALARLNPGHERYCRRRGLILETLEPYRKCPGGQVSLRGGEGVRVVAA